MDITGNSAVPNPPKFFGASKQKQNDKYCHIYSTICSQQLPTSTTLQKYCQQTMSLLHEQPPLKPRHPAGIFNKSCIRAPQYQTLFQVSE